ncbi:DUF2188 domain-containing protein [Saccharibacillus sp. CPCC 101409]|uniref:DUF2188 domain-containing protein n=1 Tax=Saccharibacillus sp. CPCC 101409 TaxID=3058041 RepID=UPI00267383D8|nr:DUF2188 domain-containing protein [Saccharibacillus sp. CPCC 101409]MDO3409497.1 DUF2188 domain-containing protein [Saccharibacillus sp. CPCC 101409]
MPWNKQDYPQSMKNLDARVRNKAIEIANALLGDGYEEGRAIAIATSQAEEWAENHPEHGGKSSGGDRDSKSSHLKDSHSHSGGSNSQSGSGGQSSVRRALHVVPHEDGWAVKEEHKDKPLSTHDRKDEALKAAHKEADGRDVHVFVHDADGKLQSSSK